MSVEIKNYLFACIIVLLTIGLVNLSFQEYSSPYSTVVYPADTSFTAGIEYLSLRLLEKAERSFKKSIFLQPDYAPNHYYLAKTYAMQEKKDKALSEFKRTLEIDPEFYPALFDIGVLYGDEEQYDDAIKFLNRAIRLNPKYTSAYQKLIGIYIEIGDYESAERLLHILDRLRE